MNGEVIRIILTGICTFVEAGVGGNNRPVTAVFPNASHHEPKHHVNMIIADDEYDVETDLDTELHYNELGKRFLVVPLEGKTLSVADLLDDATCNGKPWGKRELCRLSPPLSDKAKRERRPTTPAELESVEWIPSLGRSWPRFWPMRATRRMRRGFFSAAADTHLVSASFEMPTGTIASHWVSGDVWEFSPRSMTRFRYRTAVAQEVRFDARVANEFLHIDLCEMATRRHCGYLRITRKGGSDKKPIQVVVANVTDQDRLPGGIVFCGDCGRSECPLKDCDPSPCTCVDPHYALYYNALTSALDDRPSLPRRICTFPPLKPVAMRVGGDNCPPSGYSLGKGGTR